MIKSEFSNTTELHQRLQSDQNADQTTDWKTLQCELDDGPAPRASIGLIALASDSVIEPELRRFLPIDGVGMHVNRIPMPKVVSIDTLGGMAEDIASTTHGLMPDGRLDVIAFGCTSGAMTIGAAKVAELIQKARPGVSCTDPISAGLKGLRALDCRRIGLITPYVDSVNRVVENYIREQGMEIVVKGSFNQAGDPQICRIPPNAILEAGAQLKEADIDALFVSCTALRTSSIIQKLESTLGKPVVASNQALAWDCLRLSGFTDPVEGYGQLLRI